jgi:hypothetical protein
METAPTENWEIKIDLDPTMKLRSFLFDWDSSTILEIAQPIKGLRRQYFRGKLSRKMKKKLSKRNFPTYIPGNLCSFAQYLHWLFVTRADEEYRIERVWVGELVDV